MNTIFNWHEAVEQILPDVKRLRRHLHQNPELSFQEYETAEFIEAHLRSINIKSQRLATTGVVAIIGSGEPCIALRADIDALPVEECTGLEYASRHTGVMHACGHDMHTAALLGAATILKEHESLLKGSVKLIFQPGEEKSPGGASILIQGGVLESPTPIAIFGQHVDPSMETGTVGFVEGAMMASADELYFVVNGKGAHAAQPYLGRDPIAAAVTLIQALQSFSIQSRNPLHSGVLAITSIHGGTATNIIPDRVELKGTLRSFNKSWRSVAHDGIQKIATDVGTLHNLHIDVDIVAGYPPLFNDPATVGRLRGAVRRYLEAHSVMDFEPKMWAEDFAFYADVIPAAFWMIGCGLPGSPLEYGLHHRGFTPNEDALSTGILMHLIAVEEYLLKQ